ncbi:MAG: sulfur carrier protein ThiS adenylyltransferase ThiF [Calditerrivibrio sp.]|nr:sulfur carrier protein ThiS adenylyltransferase ThiF [Calditerrivibrio sp.]
MINISLNGNIIEIEDDSTAFSIRERYKPDADIIILNGFPITTDAPLKRGDILFLIKRGDQPTPSEIEYLLVSRHTPGIYEKLKKSSVVIAGVGGLGSNVAVSLARMGVGRLRFVDFDVVEPSNLNRQYYFIDQIGQKKVYALSETLKRINPYLTYEPIDIRIDLCNMHTLFYDFDLVIEAFDRAEEKAKLTSFMLKELPDKYYIAASGVAGYGNTDTIKVRRIKERFFLVGDFETEARPGMGLMAPRVGVAANIQANLAVRILLGDI